MRNNAYITKPKSGKGASKSNLLSFSREDDLLNQAKHDLVKIWSNLSKENKNKFLHQQLEERDLEVEQNGAINSIMASYSLKDTRVMEEANVKPMTALPISSLKTISMLKQKYQMEASQKRRFDKFNRQRINKAMLKHGSLKRLKQNNFVNSISTYKNQSSLFYSLPKEGFTGSKKIRSSSAVRLFGIKYYPP